MVSVLSLLAVTYASFARDEPQDDYGHLATQAHIGYILNGYLNLDGLVSIDLFSADSQHFHVGDTLNGSRLDKAARVFRPAGGFTGTP